MKPYASQTYTITAALPYANGLIHIGHVAGAYLPADIYARYLRMRGHEVTLVCGSDEGGVAILLKAHEEGTAPQAIIDVYHYRNKETFERLGIQFDIFHRTSSALHHRVAAEFFTKLHGENKLVLQEREQFYDVKEKLFLADRYLRGECPHCAFQEAYGDQCEACGTSLQAEDLINPSSVVSGGTPIRKKTSHWYLPLNDYQAWLEQWILKEHEEWRPNVYGQCKSWLKQGLQPRAITRDLNWGVPLPLASDLEKVLYVWFEAPIGYISATRAWAAQQGKDWRRFWQDPNTELVHFVGKDNIVFHCIIFPAMLKAHGGYILPTYVAANEFMNLEGKKISTSRDHAVWVEDYLANHPGKEDILRYVLCANAPETKDSNFQWSDFQRRNNQELVAILGNFVYRVFTLIHKYLDGAIPAPNVLLPIDRQLMDAVSTIPDNIGDAIETFQFKKGLEAMMEFARIGNKYIADTAPWKIAKQDPERMHTILYLNAQIIAHIARYSRPYLPFTSKKLYDMLHLSPMPWDDNYAFECLAPGHLIAGPTLLFEQILDETTLFSPSHRG